jgi:hypothetical protein
MQSRFSFECTDKQRQAGLVSQNQICQCKHDIQFGRLLLQPAVSSLSVSEQSLNYAGNMFHLGWTEIFYVLHFWLHTAR